MLLLALVGLAEGHPNALRIVAHRADLHVTTDQITLRYATELPSHRHAGQSGEEGQEGQEVAETLSGLQVEGAGPLRAHHTEGPTTSPTGSSVVRLVAVAERQADELTLSDGNYPDLPGSFSTTITVGPGLEVLSSSLFFAKEGTVRASRAGRWQLGDSHRRTHLHVRARTGPLERALDLLAPPPPARTAWQARRTEGLDRLTGLTTTSWLAYLLAAGLIGLSTAGTDIPRRERAGWVALSGLFAALAAWVSPWTAILALGAALARPRALLLVSALPLASLGVPGPLTVCAIVAAMGAACLPAADRPAITRGVVLLAASAAAARLWFAG